MGVSTDPKPSSSQARGVGGGTNLASPHGKGLSTGRRSMPWQLPGVLRPGSLACPPPTSLRPLLGETAPTATLAALETALGQDWALLLTALPPQACLSIPDIKTAFSDCTSKIGRRDCLTQACSALTG